MNTHLDYDTSWSDAFPLRWTECRNRPVILLGPNSYLGLIYVPRILAQCKTVVAVVDDQSSESTIHGIRRWSSLEFRKSARSIDNALAVDLSASPMGNAMFGRLIDEVGVDRADLVHVLADLELPAVYQTPNKMRELTIARQRDWHQLRTLLADETSRFALDAILKLRLTFDRRHLRCATTSPEDEYFSLYSSDATFRLGEDESFCDAGAYVGSTVRKVVAATGGKFRAIHAFEPDRKSFAALQTLSELSLESIWLHNSALGDYTGSVQFLETGTMGSHVADGAGAGNTPITRLDDVVDTASFIKMDLEGFERRALLGAERVIRTCRPRMAITGYHYADDLLDICRTIQAIGIDYEFRLRHHSNYYYDSIIYAQPAGWRVDANRTH